MNAASRGIRNAFRNQIRTVSIVLILGLSIGLALAMLVARQTVQSKITSVKSSIGNTISISPAGVRGFAGGGEALKSEQLAKVATIPNVTKVSQTLSDRLTSENTNLVSAIEAGSLGNRGANNSGVGFQGPPPDEMTTRNSGNSGGATQQFTRTFTPPVVITGANDASSPSIYGGDSVTFTSGQPMDLSQDVDSAVVGKALAEKNSLSVGSTFTAYAKTITVVGIYDTGNTFSNAGLVMPLLALQRLSDLAGGVTAATVTVSSIDNLEAVTAAIKSELGTTADVVSNQDSAKETVAPLENVKTISLYSLIGAMAAGAIIILLTMVMIVRERRREIGVMKAIGASNIRIMFQFVAEAVTLTTFGLVAGLIIGIAAAAPITNTLISNSSSNSSQPTGAVLVSPGGGQAARAFRSIGNNGAESIRNLKTNVGLDILGYGIATAMIIAVVGSALPSLLISKVRPAEVMRAE